MAETIAQYQITPFTTPQNGQPGDADQVRGNDNTVRASINSHDADSGIHFQSTTIANRPAAGTAGRKWLTTDDKRVYYDSGSAWVEIGYVPSSPVADLNMNSGTGKINLQTAGITKWQVLAAGHLAPFIDNTYTIGISGGPRPSTLYTSFSVDTPLISVSTVQSPVNELTLNSVTTNGISFLTANVAKWRIQNAGHFISAADNTYDIGIVAANRPRNVYVGGVVDAGAFRVNGLQVVSGRSSGWVAFTGTTNRGTAYDTSSITLVQLAQRVADMQAMLLAQGMIGT